MPGPVQMVLGINPIQIWSNSRVYFEWHHTVVFNPGSGSTSSIGLFQRCKSGYTCRCGWSHLAVGEKALERLETQHLYNNINMKMIYCLFKNSFSKSLLCIVCVSRYFKSREDGLLMMVYRADPSHQLLLIITSQQPTHWLMDVALLTSWHTYGVTDSWCPELISVIAIRHDQDTFEMMAVLQHVTWSYPISLA